MARTVFLAVLAFFAAASCAWAQTIPLPGGLQSDAAPPYEIVKQDIDLEADPNGQYWESEETVYRPLTSLGVQALQQMSLSYTSGYQGLMVVAYTLKKDGRKIEVPEDGILRGHGETTSPGFADSRTLTVVFPDLQVGDQAVITTRTQQHVPWFPNVFARTETFSRFVSVKEARFALTTRGNDGAFHIVVSGLEAEPPITLGGKTRRVWRYRNDKPVKRETDTVVEIADSPHISITTLQDYAKVTAIYAPIFQEKGKVTTEITDLANRLTEGVTDRRAQAKLLYDWVTAHIRYVNIVLGAGGFVPHEAGAVLKNGYGDCKDHVMLLQALLASKGIDSSPVLIRAAVNQFKLPANASPFIFDHLISYIPEFDLFLDSTSRYAPFGVLPAMDAGKAVVIVNTGKIATTPPRTAANNSLSTETNLTINENGSADGSTRIQARGSAAIDMRNLMDVLPVDAESEFFRGRLGPGSDGKFQRGNPEALEGDYNFSARYSFAHLANMPGPGALPSTLSFKPFTFSQLIGLDLPPSRTIDYACSSGTYQDSVTVTLPKSIKTITLPAPKTLMAEGIELRLDYKKVSPRVIQTRTYLRLNRAGPVCRAADYAKVRPALSGMVGALMAQVLYQ